MRSLRSRLFRSVVKYWMSPKFNDFATVEEQRRALEGFSKLSILPRTTRKESLYVGDLEAEWISANRTPDKGTVLYIHGGAYNIGSLNTHRDLAARISQASGARALLVDYRLAPEHVYPAAVEDVVMAYRWLLTNGSSSDDIVIAGDSAGGGLAIAALVSLRDAGVPLPAATVCLSPWTDLEMTGESTQTRKDTDPFLTSSWLRFMAKNYFADSDPRTPLISPIYTDMSNLPPMLIQVGSDEILFSDSTRLAEHARKTQVDVTLEIWEDMWHVWHFFAGQMPEGRQAMEKVGAFIRKHCDLH